MHFHFLKQFSLKTPAIQVVNLIKGNRGADIKDKSKPPANPIKLLESKSKLGSSILSFMTLMITTAKITPIKDAMAKNYTV